MWFGTCRLGLGCFEHLWEQLGTYSIRDRPLGSRVLSGPDLAVFSCCTWPWLSTLITSTHFLLPRFTFTSNAVLYFLDPSLGTHHKYGLVPVSYGYMCMLGLWMVMSHEVGSFRLSSSGGIPGTQHLCPCGAGCLVTCPVLISQATAFYPHAITLTPNF